MNRPEAASPLRPAARHILRLRLRSATRLVKDVSAGCVRKPEYIHQLRVSIRRAEAAISAFEPELRPRAVTRARKRLRAVRKAAGAVRDCDVHRVLLKGIECLKDPEQASVLKYLKRRLKASRKDAAREVLGIARPKRIRKLKRARRALLDLPDATAPAPELGTVLPSPATLLGAALRTFASVNRSARDAGAADLTNLDSLHALRVSAKQVRYAVEIFRSCLPQGLCDSTLSHLREFQANLGRVNDARQLSAWLADEAQHLFNAKRVRVPRRSTPELIHEELRVIVGRLEAELTVAHQAALPQIASRLDAALRPLEEWTAAAGLPAPDREAASPRQKAPGRHAEGAGDQHAPTTRRLTITAS